MRTSAEIFADVAAIAEGRPAASLVELFNELEIAVMMDDALPADVSERIETLLRSESYLQLAESWRLVRFLDGNWELVTEAQQQALRPWLVEAFDKFADWMGAFVTSEVLGGHYADAAALRELTSLAAGARMPARALAAHGFGMLARTTDDASTQAAAVERLRALSQSDDDTIRIEATEALRKIPS
jgi:hypothetical protein